MKEIKRVPVFLKHSVYSGEVNCQYTVSCTLLSNVACKKL